jgi:hypothetical protein
MDSDTDEFHSGGTDPRYARRELPCECRVERSKRLGPQSGHASKNPAPRKITDLHNQNPRQLRHIESRYPQPCERPLRLDLGHQHW